MMKEYENIVPGAAKTIFLMAENNQKHRMEMELRQAKLVKAYNLRSQWFALFVAIIALGASMFAMSRGMETAASLVGGASIAGIILAFLHKHAKRKS